MLGKHDVSKGRITRVESRRVSLVARKKKKKLKIKEREVQEDIASNLREKVQAGSM